MIYTSFGLINTPHYDYLSPKEGDRRESATAFVCLILSWKNGNRTNLESATAYWNREIL